MDLAESIDYFRSLDEGSSSITRERQKLHKKLKVPKGSGWTETGPMRAETPRHKFKLDYEKARIDVKRGREGVDYYGSDPARTSLRLRDEPRLAGPYAKSHDSGTLTVGGDPMDAKIDAAAYRQYTSTGEMPKGYKIVFGKFQRVAPGNPSTRFSKHKKSPRVGVGSDPQHARWKRLRAN
jgi:hypothetical protein